MRKPVLAATAAFTMFVSAPASAQDETAPSAVTVSGGATVVSDYRFRGISQSNRRVAVQGTFTVSHETGLYGTVWGSSIDDYIADNSTELDLVAGYKKTFGGTTIDVGGTYYYYPNSSFANSDFAEFYGSLAHTLGPVTGKATVYFAPKQRALSYGPRTKEDNLYLSGDLSASIPETPLALNAHVGHSFERSYLTFGEKYTDWSVGASYTWKNVSASVSYVDSDADLFNGTRNISKAGVVASLGVAF